MHIYANVHAAQWRDLYLQWQEWNAKHGNCQRLSAKRAATWLIANVARLADIYHYLRQWADERRAEAVYWYTDKPTDYGIVC